MTKIDFYFDPICPFSWITSRWLHQVSAHRDIDVTWRPFSLTLKNNEVEPTAKEAEHAELHRSSHRILRVMAAAREHGADFGELYTAFGIQRHVALYDFDDEVIEDVIKEAGLPSDLSKSADDKSHDKWLRSELESATKIVGDDTGVPTIIFSTPNGKQGYFGPVLNELPNLEESLQIWDGLEKLATVSSFYELKRNRPSGQPNVASTAKC